MSATTFHIVKDERGKDGKEWLMIELQGEIVSNEEEEEAEDISTAHPPKRNGKLLGKIQYADPPQLMIGNAQLDGKRMKLAAPLAILKKQKQNGQVVFNNLGFVTEKLIFKTRPKPQSSAM